MYICTRCLKKIWKIIESLKSVVKILMQSKTKLLSDIILIFDNNKFIKHYLYIIQLLF